jgi:hypothetical protein
VWFSSRENHENGCRFLYSHCETAYSELLMKRQGSGFEAGEEKRSHTSPQTRISCARHQATAAGAAFVKESRMKFINADRLHRKSGNRRIAVDLPV